MEHRGRSDEEICIADEHALRSQACVQIRSLNNHVVAHGQDFTRATFLVEDL
jgi:hypothetical protein